MGLFDSLFGGGTTETESSTDTKVRFPIQFRDLATAVGQMGSGLAGTDPNNMIAGFSPDQLAAFQALRDLATTDPTQYFSVINQLQQEGAAAGSDPAISGGLDALTGLITQAQDDPNVSQAIDNLLSDADVGDVNAETYRPGVDTDTVTADPYSTSAIEETMSPYRQQVIDRFTEDYNRQADIDRAKTARERAGRRAFGSRADLAESEEDRNINDVYATKLASLLEGGFTNAQGQFNENAAKRLEAAKANQATGLSSGLAGMEAALRAEQGNQATGVDLAKLGQTGSQAAGALSLDKTKLGGDLAAQLTAGGIDKSKLGLAGAQAAADAAGAERATAIGNTGLLSTVGEAYQGQQQQVLDAPWVQLDRLTGTLAGVPTGSSSTTTGTVPTTGGSPFSQLAGAGLTAYGLITGQADGGVVKGGLDGDVLSPRGLKRMYADGGSIMLNPYLGKSLEELEAILDDPGLTQQTREQVLDAIENWVASSGDDVSEDDASVAAELERMRDLGGTYLEGTALNAELNGAQPGDPALTEVQDAAALNEARRREAESRAAYGDYYQPTSPSPLDNPMIVGGPAFRGPGQTVPLTPLDEVPMLGTVPLTGRYEAMRSGRGEPRGIDAPGRITTGIRSPLDDPALIASATGAPPALLKAGPSAGAVAQFGTGVAAPAGVAPVIPATIDFSQPGSMLQVAQNIFSGPSPTGAPSPSSSAAAPATGLPFSSGSSPQPLGGSVAPFTPPLPVPPPSRGEADAAMAPGTPLDDRDWLSRALDNPYVQLGLALMSSQNPSFFGAVGDAGQAVAASRGAAADAAWERDFKNRGMALDEALFDLKRQELAAKIAATAARGGGGGGGGGRGGGSGGGGGGSSGASPTQVKQIEYLTQANIAAGMEPGAAQARAIAMVYNEDLPGDAAPAVSEVDLTNKAIDLVNDSDEAALMTPDELDAAVASTKEMLRRQYGMSGGTGGGFGGLGGLEFYSAAPVAPLGFTLD